MKITHKKRPYLAFALQWTGDNVTDLQDLLEGKATVTKVGDVAWVRYAPGHCKVMHLYDWAVKGQNEEIKFYSDDVFHVKYEEIE